MVWIPAQAVSEQVERVGAYAGIASFFGIALLAVLYFAQARELKRLREWAGRAPERARELEQRVAEDATRRAEAQDAPAAATRAAAPGAVPAAAEGPVAPETPVAAEAPSANGVAAPDGADAPPSPAPPEEPATAVIADGAVGGPTDGDGDSPGAVPAGQGPAPPADPATERDVSLLDAAQPGGDEGAAAVPAAPRPATAAALRVGRPSTTLPRRPSPPPPPPPEPARHRRRGPGTLVLGGIVAVLALVIGAIALGTFSGDDDPVTQEGQTQAEGTPTPAPTPDPAAARGRTTVAVLNGTTTTGLAAELVEQLTQAGYREGPRGNNADQQRAASVVLYRDGADAAARDVSRVLDITDVQPMDEQTAARPIGDAQVVVIAGQDQAP